MPRLLVVCAVVTAAIAPLAAHAHVPGEILIGRTAQNQLTALNGVETPGLLPRSVFPGFPGYATATIGFESLPVDEPGDNAFMLSGSCDIRVRMTGIDPGASVFDGPTSLTSGSIMTFGAPSFDFHPIFSIPSLAAQNGQLFNIRFVLTDASGTYADSEEITVTLTPACPPDFDLNGVTNLQDIFAYLNAFFAGLTSADFDQSGGLEIQDVFGFLNAWFADACTP